MPQSFSDLQKNCLSVKENQVKAFQECLISWFRSNGRKFPWREPCRSPYEILIAEIMLQKTKAENIVFTYLQFIEKYPDFRALSKANIEELKQILKVLGLSNVRAKSIWRLTQEIIRIGNIPKKREELLKLPGVGPYIANAFLLSAYNEKLPVVDTNVRRLYERLFSFKSKKDPRRDKKVWAFAEKILPEDHYKEFTWALMDFCANICRAKNPLCVSCPISGICEHGKKVLAGQT
jgi:A/G-specific adenine glycosylase